jgi:hypothetical protein
MSLLGEGRRVHRGALTVETTLDAATLRAAQRFLSSHGATR